MVSTSSATASRPRQHFVTTFIENLDGVDFENRETVEAFRDRYDARCRPWSAP